MGIGKLFLSSAGALAVFGLQFLMPASAAAQTVSPCCAALCAANGTATACEEIVVGGIGTNPGPTLAHGCIDVEAGGGAGDICYGGRILSSAPGPALLDGCLCVLGGPGGPGQCVGIPSGDELTPEQCTAAAIAQCGEAVVTTPCGGGECEPPGCCLGATSCTDLATASTCAGAGETFVVGHVCTDTECAGADPCGDGTCNTDGGENCSTCAADCACTGGTSCVNGTCTATEGCCQVGTSHCFACGDPQCGSAACVQGGTCEINSSTGGHCIPPE